MNLLYTQKQGCGITVLPADLPGRCADHPIAPSPGDLDLFRLRSEAAPSTHNRIVESPTGGGRDASVETTGSLS